MKQNHLVAAATISTLALWGGSALAAPPWAGDNCPPQISNAFNGPKSSDQCAAVIVVLKSGGTQVCGCNGLGVGKYNSVNDKIPPADQQQQTPIQISVTKTVDKRDPIDPCQTIMVGGVPVTYCW